MPHPGDVIDERYVVERLLGEGGLAQVYQVRHRDLGSQHALKILLWKKASLTERLRLSERAFRAHPRRSALYDAMGGGHDSLVPLVEQFESRPGDRYLLCTDGLIDGLWERQIAEILAEPGTPEETRDRLLSRARQSSDMDDATLIVIDFSHGNG